MDMIKAKRICDKINSKPPLCWGDNGVIDLIKNKLTQNKTKPAQKKQSKTTKPKKPHPNRK